MNAQDTLPVSCLGHGPFPTAYRNGDRIKDFLCPDCLAHGAQAKQERKPRAAALRVQVAAMAARGLTERGLLAAARSGDDIFGVQSMTETEWDDWLLCMEDAATSLPPGHSLRPLIHAVRPTSNRVRMAFLRAQKTAAQGEQCLLPRGGRINAMRRANEALETDFQEAEFALALAA